MTTSKNNPPDFMLGVDLGGTKILAGVIDPTGKAICREKMPTFVDGGVSEVVRRIVCCIDKVIEKSGIPKERISSVGLGAPGPLNQDTGILEAPPNLTGWKNVPLKDLLEKHTGLSVHLENDVNAGTYGELKIGAGVGAKDLIGIFIGTGIGGGLIINGQLHRGFNRTAGEVGHMILDPEGPLCGCGHRGCYEAFASRPNVVRRIKEISVERKTSSSIFALDQNDEDGPIRSSQLRDAWLAGDECVIAALKEMCYYSGLALGSLINLLSPEMIILGGGVIEALEGELLPLIAKSAFANSFKNARRNVRIRPAILGDDAGIVGAAFLASENLSQNQIR